MRKQSAWTLVLALLVGTPGCATDDSNGSGTQQPVLDCRSTAQACGAGFACRETKDGWTCMPDGSAPDVGPVDVATPDVVTTSDEGPDVVLDTDASLPDLARDTPAVPETVEEVDAPTPDASEPDVPEPDVPEPDVPEPDVPVIDVPPPVPLSVSLDLTEGETLSGLYVLTVTTKGDHVVLGVELQIDGLPMSTDVVPPYRFVINTLQWGDGPHLIEAFAADLGGGTDHSAVAVVFDNTPPQVLDIQPPASGTAFYEDGPIPVHVEIADPDSLTLVTIRANGLLVADLTTAPFDAEIPTNYVVSDPTQLPRNVLLSLYVEDELGQVTETSHTVGVHSRYAWEFTSLGEFWGGPQALPNGNLVAANLNDRLFAITPQGQSVWTFQANAEISEAAVVDPEDGRVYFGTQLGQVYCVNNGSQVWSQSLGSAPAGQFAVRGARLFTATFDGTVRSHDKTNGGTQWTVTLPAPITASPAVNADGRVFIGCQDSNLYAIEDGQLQWSTETGSEVWSTPAVGPTGIVYFGSNDGWFYARQGDDGGVLWEAQLEGQLWSRAVLGDDLSVYMASTTKHLHKFDAINGMPLWDTKLEGITRSSPALDDDGVVYIGTTPGTLFALDSETGDILFKYDVEGTIHGTPLVLGDRVIFGSTNRSLFAIWRHGMQLPLPPN